MSSSPLALPNEAAYHEALAVLAAGAEAPGREAAAAVVFEFLSRWARKLGRGSSADAGDLVGAAWLALEKQLSETLLRDGPALSRYVAPFLERAMREEIGGARTPIRLNREVQTLKRTVRRAADVVDARLKAAADEPRHLAGPTADDVLAELGADAANALVDMRALPALDAFAAALDRAMASVMPLDEIGEIGSRELRRQIVRRAMVASLAGAPRDLSTLRAQLEAQLAVERPRLERAAWVVSAERRLELIREETLRQRHGAARAGKGIAVKQVQLLLDGPEGQMVSFDAPASGRAEGRTVAETLAGPDHEPMPATVSDRSTPEQATRAAMAAVMAAGTDYELEAALTEIGVTVGEETLAQAGALIGQRKALLDALARLDVDAQVMVYAYYGLDGEAPMSAEELAADFDRTPKEVARAIEVALDQALQSVYGPTPPSLKEQVDAAVRRGQRANHLEATSGQQRVRPISARPSSERPSPQRALFAELDAPFAREA